MKEDLLYIKRRLDIEKTFRSCGVKNFEVSPDLVVTWRGHVAVMVQDIKCIKPGYSEYVSSVFTKNGIGIREVDLHKVESVDVLIENGCGILILEHGYSILSKKWRDYIELKY